MRIHNQLSLRVEVNTRQVGGFHSGNKLQHLKQLSHQSFEGVFIGERLRHASENKIGHEEYGSRTLIVTTSKLC
ncbi:Uncharacterised protein [Klebsiella pneumoniae]|nr:Uncharacterised protein [Klebsiella pneumoniae]